MSVITDDKQHYWVDGRVLGWLHHANENVSDQFAFPGQSTRLSSVVAEFYSPHHRTEWPGSNGLVVYEIVERNSQTQRTLCNMQPSSQPQPRLFGYLRSIFCGTGSAVPATDVANLRVELTKGEPNADIACATGSQSVEIHFAQARFKFSDMFGNGSMVIGPVTEPILDGISVVMHEVGHWFKLPHLVEQREKKEFEEKSGLADFPDFMMPSYTDSMCATPLSIFLLSNMTDPDTYEKHSAGGGCLRAK